MVVREEINDNNWIVDIFTSDADEPISIRDAFLYTGHAKEKPNIGRFQTPKPVRRFMFWFIFTFF